MWAHYGNKHTGVALGFDIPDELATPITYTSCKIRVPLGPMHPKHGLGEEILTRVPMTKSAASSDENEHRVEARLRTPDPKTGLYYIDCGEQLQLRELALGCPCQWSRAHAVEHVGAVIQPLTIVKARPAFGRFEMARQQAFPPIKLTPR